MALEFPLQMCKKDVVEILGRSQGAFELQSPAPTAMSSERQPSAVSTSSASLPPQGTEAVHAKNERHRREMEKIVLITR
jgi:hypothetical protein